MSHLSLKFRESLGNLQLRILKPAPSTLTNFHLPEVSMAKMGCLVWSELCGDHSLKGVAVLQHASHALHATIIKRHFEAGTNIS